LADEALHSSRRAETVVLARKALALDGECTDAQVLLTREEATSPKDLAARLKIIVDRAEAKLGAPFLRDHREQLWEIPPARPLLRARLALALALEKAGRPIPAALHLQGLLKSDPRDHLEARFPLVRCLLAANDLKTLGTFLKSREGEVSAFFAWAALLERIHAGAGKSAEKALAHARQTNPYFEEYLTGRRKLPRKLPVAPEPGTPEEAALAFHLFGESWANDREGMYWLFTHPSLPST
jgi:hypothetical protein